MKECEEILSAQRFLLNVTASLSGHESGDGGVAESAAEAMAEAMARGEC